MSQPISQSVWCLPVRLMKKVFGRILSVTHPNTHTSTHILSPWGLLFVCGVSMVTRRLLYSVVIRLWEGLGLVTRRVQTWLSRHHSAASSTGKWPKRTRNSRWRQCAGRVEPERSSGTVGKRRARTSTGQDRESKHTQHQLHPNQTFKGPFNWVKNSILQHITQIPAFNWSFKLY